jgi:glutathione S-transferase
MSDLTYKLVYFALKGRAFVSRMILAQGGQQYEDVHVNFEDWVNVKNTPTYPFGQAPVLEIIEGNKTTRIAQSNAIERFLARRFNLLGKDEVESARVDMINEQIVDTFNNLVLIYRKKDSDEKAEELNKALSEAVPNSLKMIEKLLQENNQEHNNGFLVGDSLTYADLKLISFYDWLRERREKILDQFSFLKEHNQMVRNLPRIKDFLAQNDSMRLTILFPN